MVSNMHHTSTVYKRWEECWVRIECLFSTSTYSPQLGVWSFSITVKLPPLCWWCCYSNRAQNSHDIMWHKQHSNWGNAYHVMVYLLIVCSHFHCRVSKVWMDIRMDGVSKVAGLMLVNEALSWLIQWCHSLTNQWHAVCWRHIFSSTHLTWNPGWVGIKKKNTTSWWKPLKKMSRTNWPVVVLSHWVELVTKRFFTELLWLLAGCCSNPQVGTSIATYLQILTNYSWSSCETEECHTNW